MNNYWEQIPGNMFDFRGFYDWIADNLPDNCKIAEVGVADGKSAVYLAEKLKSLNKTFHLYIIDSLNYGGTEQLNTIIKHVTRSGLAENITIYPYDSLTASCMFNDHALDFVFIDASHKYENTKADIRLWYRKLKDESILAGHDMFSKENPEVALAVNEVVPKLIRRTPINGSLFQPEKVLFTEDTDNNDGIWFFKKQWYLKLN